MKTMFKQKWRDGWLEKRLVWFEGTDKGNEIDASQKEKLSELDAKTLTERVKTLKMPEMKLNPPNRQEVENVLKKAADTKEMKDLKIKNLATYLMRGLEENLTDPAVDKTPAQKDKAITQYLKDKNVGSIAIDQGKWVFMTAGKTPEQVKAPNRLDNAAITSDVLKAKQADQKEVDKKADTERQKPENLEKVESVTRVDLDDKIKSVADLTSALEKSFKPVGAITAGELKAGLDAYIAAAAKVGKIKGDTPEDQSKDFLAKVKAEGFTRVFVRDSHMVFSDGKEPNPRQSNNPLDQNKPIEGGKYAAREIWAHPALEAAKEKKAGEAKEKVEKAKDESVKLKETPLDDTEKKIAELVKPAAVDKRNLAGLKAILDYNNDGNPVKLSIPVNDINMECQFYRSSTGTFIMKWGPGDNYWEYNPTAAGKQSPAQGLKEAQRDFARKLNSGELIQVIQNNAVMDKKNYEAWGMVVDEGPTKISSNPNQIKMEFDWKTGPGGDPDVYITVLPHGDLLVQVDQSDIMMKDSPKPYIFRAGGFQDMIRNLKSLQKYAESPKEVKQKMEVHEHDRRFLEMGSVVLDTLKGGADAGKLIRVNSAPRVGETKDGISNDLSTGYLLDFDWMQKLDPAQRLKIATPANDISGDTYELILKPSNEKIGEIKSPLNPETFAKAMKLVEAQKKIMTLEKGKENMTAAAQDLLKQFNEKGKSSGIKYAEAPGDLEFAGNGVRVVGMSEGVVYLSRDGAKAVPFQFGKMVEGKLVANDMGILDALKQGYLISKPVELSEKKKMEAGKPEPERPQDKVSFKLVTEKGVIPDSEKPSDWAIKGEVRNNVLKDVKMPQKEYLRAYMVEKVESITLVGKDDNEKKAMCEKAVWEVLAKLVGKPVDDHKAVMVELNKPDFGKKMSEKNEKAIKPLDLSPDALKKLEKLPKLKARLRGFVEDLADLKIDKADPSKMEAAKKAYHEGLKATVEDVLKNIKVINSKTDQDIYKNFKVRAPSVFCREYLRNEEVKVTHDAWEKDQKAVKAVGDVAPVEVAKPSDAPIEAKVAPENKENIPDSTAKLDAVKAVLNPLTAAPNYQKFRKMVLAELEQVRSEDVKANPKKGYEDIVWKKLAEIAGKDSPKNDADKKALITELKGQKEDSASYKEKLSKVPEAVRTALKDTPATQAFVVGLVDSLDSDLMKYADFKIGPDDMLKAKEAYKNALPDIVKSIVEKNPKGALSNDKYDEMLATKLVAVIKNPRKFMEEYGNKLDQQKKYDEYKEFKKGQDALKDYEKAKQEPSVMSFEEFSKLDAGGIVPSAMPIMAKTKGIDLKEPGTGLSRIDGNNSVGKELSFNVKGGKAPDQVLMTLTFVNTTKNELIVYAAEGWNNKSYRENLSVIVTGDPKADPVKTVVDRMMADGDAKRMSVSPEKPKAPDAPKVEGEKPGEPKKPAEDPGKGKPEGPKKPEGKPSDEAKPKPEGAK